MSKQEQKQACACETCERFAKAGINLELLSEQISGLDKGTASRSLMKIHNACVHFIDPDVFNTELQYALEVTSDVAKALFYGKEVVV